MILYREYGCKGIIKCYCCNCFSLFYISNTGPDGHDRMYEITKELASQDAVSVVLSYSDEYEEQFVEEYETDNDFESYGIIHRISYSRNKQGYITKFEKGPNYYDYASNLWHRPLDGCPYCGSSEYRWWSINRKREEFFCEVCFHDPGKEKANSYLQEHLSKYEQDEIALPKPNGPLTGIRLKNFLQCLVNTETNIDFLKKRLKSVYPEYFMAGRTLKAALLQDKLPDIAEIVKRPSDPVYEKPSLFNKKRVNERNNKKRDEYLTSDNYIAHQNSVCQYEHAKAEFNSQTKELACQIDKHMEDFTLADFSFCEPALTQKVSVLSQEIIECQTLLQREIYNKRKLYATGVLFGKYRNLVAEATLLEYVESGRCDALEGHEGAYNIYENELRANMIISKVDQIIDSLDQIRQSQYILYTALDTINTRLKKMDANTQAILEVVDNIEYSSRISAYNSSQAAYYAEVTANNTAVSSFFDMYNALK